MKRNRKVTHTEGTTKTSKIASEGSHDEFSNQRLQNYHKYIDNLKSIENIKVEDFNINQFNLWKKEIDNKNYSTAYKNHQYFIAVYL